MQGKHQLLHASLAYKVRWYVNLRWLYLISLSTPGLVSLYATQGATPTFRRSLIIALAGLGYNAVFYFLARRNKAKDSYYRTIAWIQVVSDIVLTTFLIISGGGVESRAIILYGLGIIISGALFGYRANYIAAALSALAYDLVIILDHKGVIRSGEIAAPQLHGDLGYTLTTVSFYTAALFILAAVSSFVTKLLTEQEKVAVVQSEALETAQGIAHIGSWEWDVANDEITWSEEMYRIYGLDPAGQAVSFDTFIEKVHPEDRSSVRSTIVSSLQGKKGFEFDHRILLPDGKERFLHAIGFVKEDNSRAVVKMTGVGQDITEQKIAETDLRRRTEELEKLNRLMVDRELRMVELKKEITKLEQGK